MHAASRKSSTGGRLEACSGMMIGGDGTRAGVRPGYPTSPMRPAQRQNSQDSHSRHASPGRAVVLVVEDDPEINDLERQLLAAGGLESVGVLAGDEALAAVQRSEFAAVLLDLMLPGMDGFETC